MIKRRRENSAGVLNILASTQRSKIAMILAGPTNLAHDRQIATKERR
jgi:hypothetical protein